MLSMFVYLLVIVSLSRLGATGDEPTFPNPRVEAIPKDQLEQFYGWCVDDIVWVARLMHERAFMTTPSDRYSFCISFVANIFLLPCN